MTMQEKIALGHCPGNPSNHNPKHPYDTPGEVLVYPTQRMYDFYGISEPFKICSPCAGDGIEAGEVSETPVEIDKSVSMIDNVAGTALEDSQNGYVGVEGTLLSIMGAEKTIDALDGAEYCTANDPTPRDWPNLAEKITKDSLDLQYRQIEVGLNLDALRSALDLLKATKRGLHDYHSR